MQSITNIQSSSMAQNFSWLHRGLTEIFPHKSNSDSESESLEKLLATTDRPLRVKFGIDPPRS